MRKLFFGILVSVFVSTGAFAYTYTRDASTACVNMMDVNKGSIKVCPGETLTTYQNLTTGWTLTANTPYYTPVVSRETVTASGAGTEEVDITEDGVAYIMVSDVTADITVTIYFNEEENTPAAWVASSVSPFCTDFKLRNGAPKFGKLQLVFSGAGSCSVSTYKEELRQ